MPMADARWSQRSIPISLACALIAVLVSGLAAIATLSLGAHNATVLVRMSNVEPMAPLAYRTDPGFKFVSQDAHYDGVYYYTIARDPFATEQEHTRIDLAAYRYEHGGYGLLAALFTLGNDRAVPIALLLINLAAAGVGAAIASLICRRIGVSEWGGLALALNLGVVYSATVDTSEPLQLMLLGCVLLAWLNRRWALAALSCAALLLTKEIYVFVPVALLMWEAIRYLKGERGRQLGARIAALAVGPVVLAMWIVYLHGRFGVWPFKQAPPGITTAPLVGWITSLQIAAGQGFSTADSSQVGQASVALLSVCVVVVFLGIYRAARLRNLLDVVYLFSALVLLSLGPLGIAYPKDLFRLSAVPITLVGAVLIGYRRNIETGEPMTPASSGSASAS
ncbi:MAG TPA: hypothetical protein VFK89_04090 [Actinomycetota bacterium]|nr:hypothetical protein [Actinomycetota bacterium]